MYLSNTCKNLPSFRNFPPRFGNFFSLEALTNFFEIVIRLMGGSDFVKLHFKQRCKGSLLRRMAEILSSSSFKLLVPAQQTSSNYKIFQTNYFLPAIAEIDLNEIAWTLFGPFIDGNQLTKSPAICYRMYLKTDLVNYQSSARDFSEEDSTERMGPKPKLGADEEESLWRHITSLSSPTTGSRRSPRRACRMGSRILTPRSKCCFRLLSTLPPKNLGCPPKVCPDLTTS